MTNRNKDAAAGQRSNGNGGAFARKTFTESDVELAREHLEELAARQREVVDEEQRALASYIAKSVLVKYPTAATLVLGESDQPGCTWHPEHLIDADGNTIPGAEDDDLLIDLTAECWSLPSQEAIDSGTAPWWITVVPVNRWNNNAHLDLHAAANKISAGARDSILAQLNNGDTPR